MMHPVKAAPKELTYPRNRGAFRFHLNRATQAKMRVYCGPKGTARYNAMHRAICALGDFCVDDRNGGTLSWQRIRDLLGAMTTRPTRRQWIFWLTDAGVLHEEHGGGVNIDNFARDNRSKEEWLAIAAQKTANKTAQKRAQRARERGEDRVEQVKKLYISDLQTPVNSTLFEPVATSKSKREKTPPPPPQKQVALGGGVLDGQQAPPTPPPLTADRGKAKPYGLSQIDPMALVRALGAQAQSPSEAHPTAEPAKPTAEPAASRIGLPTPPPSPPLPPAPAPSQAAPSPAQVQATQQAQAWAERMLAKSRARHGGPVDDAKVAEALSNRSRPAEIRLAPKAPITPAELDALLPHLPADKRAGILAGGYPLARVKRVYAEAVKDPGLRCPDRAVLARLQAGQGVR